MHVAGWIWAARTITKGEIPRTFALKATLHEVAQPPDSIAGIKHPDAI